MDWRASRVHRQVLLMERVGLSWTEACGLSLREMLIMEEFLRDRDEMAQRRRELGG